MRLKYYLRGAGIGILVTTIILTIAFQVYGRNERRNEETVLSTESGDPTIAEALSDADSTAEQRQTEATESPEPVTEQQTEAMTEPDADAEGEPETEALREAQSDANNVEAETDTAEAAGSESDAAGETAQTDGNQADEADTSGTTKATSTPAKTYTVRIYHGDSPHMVATMLEGDGVIDDGEEFYAYLVENGYNDLLEVGEFEIPSSADYAEITRILTTNEYERRMR